MRNTLKNIRAGIDKSRIRRYNKSEIDKNGGNVMENEAIKERAKEMQREYLREWRRKNKDKLREYRESYWIRKASKEANSDDENN